ncbi:MAG: class I SAM-dependent methyltransferase [Gammaproteobacteria bacterium]|nr:class I SAM-dependent methyltransferase [Gammaproteobacteria bacterium]
MYRHAAWAAGDFYLSGTLYPGLLEKIIVELVVQKKWDERYRKAPDVEPRATDVLLNNLHLLPAQGKALDLACGLGGNARLLAGQGLDTSAWDISPVALQALDTASEKHDLKIETRVCDVLESPPPAASFDVIVVARFLDRRLFPHLRAALKPGGVLFYQTFTLENTGKGGPANPDFLLRSNELLEQFRDLTVLSFRDEGRQGDLQAGLRNESWIIVKKGSQA